MRARWRIVSWITGGAILAAALALAGLWWYREAHRMRIATSFDVNDRASSQAVLVATQGSRYKDAVVHQIADRYRGRDVHLRVVDVSRLEAESSGDWVAIVILHTWESGLPQPDAARFVAHLPRRDRIIVLSTSGSGREAIPGIDAITSASSMDGVARDARRIIERLDRLLAAPGARSGATRSSPTTSIAAAPGGIVDQDGIETPGLYTSSP